ncbi:MAG TPA: flagellar basal body L-ring protein FlgH [Fimbriimonadaceae bacterium]|nr:flagellar basal body L-ring protein FlgH [Fimbriimonadaceae bacterium]
MKTRLLSLTLALSFGTIAVAQVDEQNPGSLWPKKYVNPLLDRTARAEGDVVTILISEVSSGSFTATTTAAKTANNSITKALGPIIGGLIPDLATLGNTTTDGKGATTQVGKLTARMTAIVKKVLPNGTMVIEGSRSVQVNKETQTFRLSGLIRRDDIRPDNTVLSENIAEAQINVDGKGQIADRQKRGILTRLLDWLF